MHELRRSPLDNARPLYIQVTARKDETLRRERREREGRLRKKASISSRLDKSKRKVHPIKCVKAALIN